jgi:Tfp pilus assembly protein PilF
MPAPAPAPAATPAPAPVVATPQPVKPAKQVKPAAIAKTDTPVHAPEVNETIARKVSLLLSKANGYVENKQYDKAIATAENVLELDPGSAAAQAMISKAKTKQLDALRSGSTLE